MQQISNKKPPIYHIGGFYCAAAFRQKFIYALQHLIYYFGINIHIKFTGKHCRRILNQIKILHFKNIGIAALPIDKASAGKVVIAAVFHINIIRKRRI